MKSMLQHSFVLDALETTGADTFSHFEVLIDEHRQLEYCPEPKQPSRLKQLVPTIGVFHTSLPLRKAFEEYNEKHCLTKRKHIQISFNEIRHILNLAQIMALCREGSTAIALQNGGASMAANGSTGTPSSTSPMSRSSRRLSRHASSAAMFKGPRLISFDGDQTLYSDGANFESNPKLANYLYLLLKNGCSIAVVTAAGYEYNVEKYEHRLSGLLQFFKNRGLSRDECERFYLFGGK
jgi:IMP and pyridine-specific 5'-nucleotidase